MSAMDQMIISLLQKMTGLSPDQMQSLAGNAIHLLQSLDARLKAIEDKLDIERDIIQTNILEDQNAREGNSN